MASAIYRLLAFGWRRLTQPDRVACHSKTLASMAMIGYARGSTTDQNPETQAARLRGHGCTRVFTEHGVTGRLASNGMPAGRTCATATC